MRQLAHEQGAGTETHSVVDHTPGENGLEAWRGLLQLFDFALAYTNFNLMSKISTPPKRKLDHMCMVFNSDRYDMYSTAQSPFRD